MDWLKPYLVSRVRVKALRALVEAGGEPSRGQLRRAIEPVLGDLLPLPSEPLPEEWERQEAADRQRVYEEEAARRCFLGDGCCGS